MSKTKYTCISCGKDITNARGSLRVSCPSCHNYEIVRCYSCRRISAKYACQQCHFTGPT